MITLETFEIVVNIGCTFLTAITFIALGLFFVSIQEPNIYVIISFACGVFLLLIGMGLFVEFFITHRQRRLQLGKN